MSQTYTIPVAFVVYAKTEAEAARVLVRALAGTHILGSDVVDTEAEIECWWTPNHPEADGSDAGLTLEWSDEARCYEDEPARTLAERIADDPYDVYGTPEHEWLLMEEERRGF